MHTRPRDLADWLAGQLAAEDGRGFLVDLGADAASAVAAGVCTMAAPGRVHGVVLHTTAGADTDAHASAIAAHFGIPLLTADLTPAVAGLAATLDAVVPASPESLELVPDDPDARRPALAARVRMASLHYIAERWRYLIVGTLNRGELTAGDFTRYGGDGVDLLPLAGQLERDILVLARDLGVPESVLEAAHGRRAGRTPDPDRGFTYDQLERYLADGPDVVPPAVALRIERLARRRANWPGKPGN